MKKFLFLLYLAPFAVLSQKIENSKAEAAGDKIIITYDLVAGEPGDNYTVTLFASHNNFASPLTRVIGDVGQNIRGGKGKHIEWEAKTELGKYKGPVTFEIEVKVLAPFTLKSSFSSVKRGKKIPLAWRGGDFSQDVKIELLKGGKVEGTVGAITNNGHYNWTIPSKQSKGKDYTLRLTNGKETAMSQTFSITPKIPLWLKIGVPVAIVAGTLLIVRPCDCPPPSEKLVAPPDMQLD